MSERRQEHNFLIKSNTFHDNIKFFLSIAQAFGVMPLHNVNKTWDRVYFKWASIRVVYSIINAVGALLSSGFWLAKFGADGIVVDKTGELVIGGDIPTNFCIAQAFGVMPLHNVNKTWDRVYFKWASIRVVYSIINAVGALLSSGFWLAKFGADGIVVDKTGPNLHSSNNVLLTNVLSTFTWIFTDVFISLISIALTAKFRRLVSKIQNNVIMHRHRVFWKEFREDYQKLYLLSKLIDKNISSLVLISYMHNIFFLCLQLYNSL
uniref:Gustatory receptor for sugar taste 64e-like n=1 Tax=Diabrotica virgifera virgifera TaxID=50390 RepID=A0A6P7GJB2_DIAVI